MTCLDHDGASEVVDAFRTAMQQAFDPASSCPPAGGGTTVVRFLAADNQGLPMSLIPQGDDCESPLLWVRVTQRFRSRTTDFPARYTADGGCSDAGVKPAIGIEIGVGRCSSLEAEPDWDVLEDEAETSLDDSWRLERVLCAVAKRLRSKERAVATDTVIPLGPEGGITAWLGSASVQLL